MTRQSRVTRWQRQFPLPELRVALPMTSTPLVTTLQKLRSRLSSSQRCCPPPSTLSLANGPVTSDDWIEKKRAKMERGANRNAIGSRLVVRRH